MQEKDRKLYRLLGVMSTVGIALVASTFIGFYIGLKLDEYFGTSPWLTVVFLILGIAAGFRNLFMTAKRINELDRDGDKK